MSDSFRMKQINQMVYREISKSISSNVNIPEDIILTITKVITSPNLNDSKIFYICNPIEKAAFAFNILKKELKQVKETFADSIVLRKTPRIKFILDKNEIRAKKIEDLLDNIKHE